MSIEKSNRTVDPETLEQQIRPLEPKNVNNPEKHYPAVKNSFYDKVKETFLLKNKTGKTILAVLITGLGFFTNTEPLNEIIYGDQMETLTQLPWDALIPVIVGILTFLTGLFIKKPGTREWIDAKITIAGHEITKAIQEDSEGGKKVTANEVRGILLAIFQK